jgi:molecular chaperone DnaK (HSP70)
MTLAVGIDLGTTNTVVAVQDDGTGPRVLCVPQPVDQRNELEPREELKSVVLFEPGESAVVGRWAARRLDSLRSIKSRMGTRWKLSHATTSTRRWLTPQLVAAHILKACHHAVCAEYAQWNRSAIITVPASFNTDQRSDTIKAAELAGFTNVRLLDEPTAAFYYFFDQQRAATYLQGKRTILVFDFGGGTLDVSIIRTNVSENRFEVDPIGRSRYNNLGGDDIDLDIAVFLLSCWEQETGESLESIEIELRRELMKRFIDAAALYKEQFEEASANGQPLPDFEIHDILTGTKDGRVLTLAFARRLTRPQYDALTGRYFEHKTELNIYKPIEQALELARRIDSSFKGKDDLDIVLYTGGASRMQVVKTALELYFAGTKCFSISDDDACRTVAIGAASCRYDELHRSHQVIMRTRLLEAIFTRDGTNYVQLVPVEAEPNASFIPIEREFRVRRALIRLRLPLFRGASPMDHQLNVMRDVVFELQRVVESGSPYTLAYRVTSNKTVELQAVFEGIGGRMVATANIDLGVTDEVDGGEFPICDVNRIRA